jgi:N-ethylmaleimide reductase
LARAAGFDGVELNATGDVVPQVTTPLLEKVQTMIDVWGADRVGVQIAPFVHALGQDNKRAADFFAQLLCALAGMEIAYLHLSGTVTPDRGDLSTSALGQSLRRAFPGMVIASGLYTPASAIAAVENRWADAIGFTVVAGPSDHIIQAIAAAGTPLGLDPQ